ncbi:3'-5' exonuclease [Paraflavisolibacter sp. H34]|uniref:3'-5' exonuclease n=1 Tax=Huijunlia imazamoxiresistens TaxID=3127457 RepID=UPI00301900C8
MNFNNILFLDIETVPQFETYSDLTEEWKELWDHKAQQFLRNKENGEDPGSVYDRAGIYAEFGKIVCISVGLITGTNGDRKLNIKSFCCDDEEKLLKDFADMCNRWATDNSKQLCAHNGKEFDFPYICRRMIINQVPIPGLLQIAGRKPWEINHIDTMELWKFGDYKSYTSLKLLALSLGIPSPKDDIDGSMVHWVYWKDKDLDRIAIYCQKDVVTLVQVLLRYHGQPFILPENVELKTLRKAEV